MLHEQQWQHLTVVHTWPWRAEGEVSQLPQITEISILRRDPATETFGGRSIDQVFYFQVMSTTTAASWLIILLQLSGNSTEKSLVSPNASFYALNGCFYVCFYAVSRFQRWTSAPHQRHRLTQLKNIKIKAFKIAPAVSLVWFRCIRVLRGDEA